MIYDGLVRWTAGCAVPALAESWQWTDNVTLSLNLRQGVSFHDGTPFTAEAVIACFDSVRGDPDSYYFSRFENVSGYERAGESGIVIRLKTPDYAFVSLLDIPIPKNPAEKANERLIGTGRYLYEKTEDGALILRKNPGWFGGRSYRENRLQNVADSDAMFWAMKRAKST